MQNIKQKAREMFWAHWGNKAEYTEQNWLTPDSRAIIFEVIDQIIDLAVSKERERIVEKIAVYKNQNCICEWRVCECDRYIWKKELINLINNK